MRKKVTPKKRILVIGESCLDVFVYCDAQRLAPDVPVPVLNVIRKTENPGMAKNVERNIKALYSECDLLTNAGWNHNSKTRYMHTGSNHAFIRIDTQQKIVPAQVRKINFKKYALIAISDYHKGFLSESDIAYICAHHPLVFVDTKKVLGPFLKDASYIKINEFEYLRSLPIAKDLAQKVIRTRGGLPVEYKGKHYPVQSVEVKDSSGAGDSFFSGLIVRFIETGDIEEAIRFANRCATEVVQHRGVSIIKRPVAHA